MSVPILDIINNISFYGWVVVGGSVLTVLLSGVVYWQDITKRSSKFFFIFGIINLIWGFVYAFFEGSFGTADTQTGMVMLYIVAAIVAPFLFLFLYVFSVEKSRISFWEYVALFLPYFIIVGIMLAFPDIIVKYVIVDGEPSKMVFGNSFWIYAAYILGYVIVGLFLLVKKYRESAGIFKIAIRNLLGAVGFACLAAVLMSLFSPIFFGGAHDFFWIGHLGVIVFLFVGTFILAEYNFWNIKIIATELFISIIILMFFIELIIAGSLSGLLVKFVLTLLVLFSSFFLVGSVKREIQSSDKIESFLKILDKMHERLKILDKKKSEFLSIASHHLRDPLTAIRGYASMLSEGSFGELSRPVYEAVEKIFESSGRLITMIDDFMDISRIESGDMKYVFVDIDLKKLVSEVFTEMKQHAERMHLAFHIKVGNENVFGEKFITVGDEGKIRQVFSNIIDNSIKYTPQGEVFVTLVKSPDKKKIIFGVIDTGIGMNESTKEKIFRKFSRADDAGKSYTEGRGLGLYVAMEIIKKHEGRIWAESKGEGLGSTFYVELEGKP